MKRFIFVAVLFLAVASVAVAGTTGKLSGIVTDDQGLPVPGATVSISSPTQIGGVQTTATEADGSFSFPGLAPGVYTVKIELTGFVAQERTEVQVRLDRTTELRVTMPQAKFGEELTVVADTPVVDPTQVSTAQTFTPEFLKGVAVTSGRRAYYFVLNMAPGVAGSDNPNVYGSADNENVFLIDGLNTTDPVTATWGTNFAFDAIQEISFQTGGYEAEYGNATGGVVNVVTKSGGNEFSGSLDIRYRETSFYENGDHFNKDDNPSEFLNPGVTLGGPILRDRLWFFAAYEYNDSQSTPNNSPTTYTYVGDYYLGKLTWQATPSWRLTGKWSSDPVDIDNRDAGPYITPEATTFQAQGGDIYSADASGVLGSNLLWNIGVGINRQVLDAYPQSGDFDTAGHFNVINGESYVNATNAQYSERNRDEYRTDLTWFVDNLAGSHEFKAGYALNDLEFWSHNFTPAGGFQYWDATEEWWYGEGDPDLAIPYLIYETTDPGPATSTGAQNSFFLQDAWKVAPNLTLKIGARYDQVAYKNDVGTEIADLSEVQPRLGLAWDITSDAKNVLKASWGRFMHPSATTLPNYARVNNATSYYWLSCGTILGAATAQECQDFVAARASRGYRYIPGPDSWDPTGWFTRGAIDVVGSEPTQVEPLDPAYADQLIIGFERELFNRTSIELTYIDKKTRGFFEDTCQGNLSGLTVDDEGYCSYYVIANFDQIKRDYTGAILKFETRSVDWMWLLASYTYATSEGSIEDTQGAFTDYDYCPEHCVNRYGYLSDDRRHRVKLNGYFILPANFTLGVDAFWSSAFAYSRTQTPEASGYGTEYLEPRGNYRADDNYEMDLSLTYRLNLGQVGVELIGSVYNVLGSERVTGVCEDVNGCGSNAFGDPDAWQTPRRFELGFRIEF